MFFDTHAHLDDPRYDSDREQLLGLLNALGISYYTNIGSNMHTSENSLTLAEKYGFVYATVGVHPHYTKDMQKSDINRLEAWMKNVKVKAIGEIGLDYYYDHSPRDVQRYWFEKQLELAEKHDFPVVIHDRDAHEDCLNTLMKYKVSGIFHCFSGSKEMAAQVIKMGYYIAFGGPLTYKNSRHAVESAEYAPIDKILLETDAPYLSPEGHRGERNNPAYVRIVAQKLADIKGLSLEEVAQITTENAKRVYRIDNII